MSLSKYLEFMKASTVAEFEGDEGEWRRISLPSFSTKIHFEIIFFKYWITCSIIGIDKIFRNQLPPYEYK